MEYIWTTFVHAPASPWHTSMRWGAKELGQKPACAHSAGLFPNANQSTHLWRPSAATVSNGPCETQPVFKLYCLKCWCLSVAFACGRYVFQKSGGSHHPDSYPTKLLFWATPPTSQPNLQWFLGWLSKTVGLPAAHVPELCLVWASWLNKYQSPSWNIH